MTELSHLTNKRAPIDSIRLGSKSRGELSSIVPRRTDAVSRNNLGSSEVSAFPAVLHAAGVRGAQRPSWRDNQGTALLLVISSQRPTITASDYSFFLFPNPAKAFLGTVHGLIHTYLSNSCACYPMQNTW